MKKTLFSLLAILMVLSLIVTACGPTPEATEAPKATEAAPEPTAEEAEPEATVAEEPEVPEEPGRILCIGNCCEKVARENDAYFVPGCPPKPEDILEAVRRME